jgi:hypothetical protein
MPIYKVPMEWVEEVEVRVEAFDPMDLENRLRRGDVPFPFGEGAGTINIRWKDIKVEHDDADI